MALIRNTSDYLYSDYTVSLPNGSGLDSGWIDMNDYDKYQFEGRSDSPNMTLRISSSRVDGGGEPDDVITTNIIESTFHLFNVICRQRYIRIEWENNTGVAVSDCSISIKGSIGSSDKLSVFPANVTPSAFSQAALVQSILRGLDAFGVYRNVAVNEIGALLTGDFGTEVARGLYDGYAINTKFGKNIDIDTGSTPEDVWNGGGDYTGFDCVSAQTIEIFSSDNNDRGAEVSSGVSTGGSETTLVDSGATFISDGVSVGDLVINDSLQFHGYITSIDSETQVTCYDFRNGAGSLKEFSSGDNYRIATSIDIGAAVVKLSGLIDSNYYRHSEYVILNGTTSVFTASTYIRQSRGQVILAGSLDTNDGEITGRQSTTTANVTMVMPAESGQTAICCDTVPTGKTWQVKRLYCSMTRANGSAGSADVQFQIRPRGGAWRTLRFPSISNSLLYNEKDIGGIIIQEQTDVRWRVNAVSDNNTIVSAEFEYFEIDN